VAVLGHQSGRVIIANLSDVQHWPSATPLFCRGTRPFLVIFYILYRSV
jgi:hypothetical protein